MIFFNNPASTSTHLDLSLICDVWLLNKNSIQLNLNLQKLLPFYPYHFVQYHFVRSPAEVVDLQEQPAFLCRISEHIIYIDKLVLKNSLDDLYAHWITVLGILDLKVIVSF